MAKSGTYKNVIKSALLGRAAANDIITGGMGISLEKTLDIADPIDISVKIKPLSSVKEGFERNGGVFSSNSLPQRNGFLSFLKTPHEYFRLKNINGLTMGKTPNTIYIHDRYFFRGLFKRNKAPLVGTIIHELQHLLQMKRHQECLRSPYISESLNLSDKFSELAKQDKDLFENCILPISSECEVQARLASVITRHAKETGILPLSTAELINALQQQGVVLPIDISMDMNSEFDIDTKSGDDVLNDAIDLTLIFACVEPQYNKQLWLKTIPSTYAEILEDWGDRLGHKRFGHTHNIRFREIFYRSIENANKMVNDPEFDEFWNSDNPKIVEMIEGQIAENFARAADIIQKMDKDDAIDLGCLVLTGFRYKEFSESTFVPPKAGNDKISDFTKAAILDRPDITERDRAILDRAESLYLPEHGEITRSTMRAPSGTLHPSLTFALDGSNNLHITEFLCT